MKIYLTYDKGARAETAEFWYNKGEAQRAARDQGHELEQHEIESRRADIVDWLNNTILPDLLDAPSEQDQPSHDADGPVDVDPETGEILDDQEPAGSHDDPEPPRSADETVQGFDAPATGESEQHRQAVENLHANLDARGAGRRPDSGGEPSSEDTTADLEDLI